MDHRLSRFKHRHNKRYKAMTESEKRYFQKRYGMTPEEYYRRKHIDDTSLHDPKHGEFKMPQSKNNSRSLRREHEDRFSQTDTSRGFDNRRSSKRYGMTPEEYYRRQHINDTFLPDPTHGEFKMPQSRSNSRSLRREHEYRSSQIHGSSLDPPSLSRASLDPPSLQRSSYEGHHGRSSLDPPSLQRSSYESHHGRSSLDPPSFRNEPSLQFSSMSTPSFSGDDDFNPSTTKIPSFGNTLNFNPSTGKASQAENDIIESMKNMNFDDI